MEYFNYLGSIITNDARSNHEIKSTIAWHKQNSTRRRLFFQQIGLKFKEETSKVLHMEDIFVSCCYLETGISDLLSDQKYLESFKMWCWRRMEISWTDQVRSEEVLQRVKEIYPTNNTEKANWIGHILHRNCHLKHLIKGKIEERIEEMGR